MDGERREIPANHSNVLVDGLGVVYNVAVAAATLAADVVDAADDLNVSDDVVAEVENVAAEDSIPRSMTGPMLTVPFPALARRYLVRRRRRQRPRTFRAAEERERRRDFREMVPWIGRPRNRRVRRRVRRKTANRSSTSIDE